MAPNDKLLIPREVATRIRVSVTTLAIWRCDTPKNAARHSDALRFIRRGRHILYRESDVESYIARLEESSTTAASC